MGLQAVWIKQSESKNSNNQSERLYQCQGCNYSVKPCQQAILPGITPGGCVGVEAMLKYNKERM